MCQLLDTLINTHGHMHTHVRTYSDNNDVLEWHVKENESVANLWTFDVSLNICDMHFT